MVGEPAGVEHFRRRASPAARRQDMVDAVARDVLEAGGVDPAQVEVPAEDQTLASAQAATARATSARVRRRAAASACRFAIQPPSPSRAP